MSSELSEWNKIARNQKQKNTFLEKYIPLVKNNYE